MLNFYREQFLDRLDIRDKREAIQGLTSGSATNLRSQHYDGLVAHNDIGEMIALKLRIPTAGARLKCPTSCSFAGRRVPARLLLGRGS